MTENAMQPIANDTAVNCHSRGNIEGVVRSHTIAGDGTLTYTVEYDNGNTALNTHDQLTVLDKEAPAPRMQPYGGGITRWVFTYGGCDYHVENYAERGQRPEWWVTNATRQGEVPLVTGARTRKAAYHAAMNALGITNA
ncbi:hypothetical protein RM572_00690 [Streptomyces sp. DSM 42041]|uniref:Uncharacterized protein n=1 Tax=Streptomyces hazeniae TaxID=3075538 RepID=A0ABU2NK44_9ACTN|nr:hypothetical protein [Streptomyces sp. DSM 42041]MDT0377293.1 hypothetical protein [Streptomyces sp. DSM 42041]